MTKQEKIEVLSKSMVRSTRDDKSEFYHFTDEAPKELVSLFLEHYEVQDLDYETFNAACDLVVDCYNDNGQEGDDLELVREMIYERAPETAGIWTSERLGYLNSNNQSDITDIVRQLNVEIADACAIWYDQQVEEAAIIINDWINA